MFKFSSRQQLRRLEITSKSRSVHTIIMVLFFKDQDRKRISEPQIERDEHWLTTPDCGLFTAPQATARTSAIVSWYYIIIFLSVGGLPSSLERSYTEQLNSIILKFSSVSTSLIKAVWTKAALFAYYTQLSMYKIFCCCKTMAWQQQRSGTTDSY